MAELAEVAKDSAERKVTAGVGIAGAIAIVAIVLYLTVFTGQPADLRQCDDAIRSHLKAPATYQRIEGKLSPLYGLKIYDVTYDANNSFGVPIRSTGQCSVEGGQATWTEPELEGGQ